MPISNTTIGKESFGRMLDGIKVATQAIRLCYGPKGLNAVVENESTPFHEVANDAQTIIQAIQVEGAVEKQGLSFLKELSEKANNDSGDGRKTTCIIAEELLTRAYEANLSGNQFKEELDSLIPLIEKNLDEQKKTITVEEIEKVASIAGESKSLGKTLGEIYRLIGPDGIIIPEASGTYTTSFTVIEGTRFSDAGYLSPYMVYDEQAVKDGKKETKAVYEKPLILVTKRKIEKDKDLEALMDIATANNKPLVIFTDDMDSGVASRMVATHQAKVTKILIIRAPVLWKNYVFEDFAKITGATIVEDASGINYKNLQLAHLGTCDKITVDKDETIIIGGQDISEHIASLKAEGTNDSKLRLSWLTTKTAILKLGANNESELSHLRLKCYDAINSSRLALKDGVVEGGGLALVKASKVLPDTQVANILKESILAPIIQNLKNMNLPEFAAVPWGEEVIDATTVIKNAVRNAVSLASTVLTTGIVITLPPKTPEQLAQEALVKSKMRF
jgi:chaperonin GroEL